MARIMRAVRRAVKAAFFPKRRRYLAKGKMVICSHCGGDSFKRRYTFSGNGLQCKACSHIEYFVNEPKEIAEDS